MRPGSHHGDWAATPQATHSHLVRRRSVSPQLLYVVKIPVSFRLWDGRLHARSAAHAGQPPRPARNAAPSGTAEVDGDLLSCSTANATLPWYPTNQVAHSFDPTAAGAFPTC